MFLFPKFTNSLHANIQKKKEITNKIAYEKEMIKKIDAQKKITAQKEIAMKKEIATQKEIAKRIAEVNLIINQNKNVRYEDEIVN